MKGKHKLSRVLILLGLLFGTGPAGVASGDERDRATLRGIKAISVVVERIDDPEIRKSGLRDDLVQGDAELKLQQAGIEVNSNAMQLLYVVVKPVQAVTRNRRSVGLYAVSFRLECLQTVTLLRDPSVKLSAPTWSVENVAVIPAGELSRGSKEILTDLLDKFINAYRSANPK